MRIDIAGQTDIGRRKKANEDTFGVFGEDEPNLTLFKHGALVCVADGLGGHVGGEIASKLAVSILKDSLKEELPKENGQAHDESVLNLMKRFVTLANASVYQTNSDLATGSKPMGTTLITSLIEPRKVYICNVGDSRCYHIREGHIIERTEDHSWVDEQVKLGLMSKSEAEVDPRKNVVTRSIGTRPEVAVDSYIWHIVPGDWLLVCSDGLVNMVSDQDITNEVVSGGRATDIVARLIDLANANGGKDNITVVAANISPTAGHMFAANVRAFFRKNGLKLLWALVIVLVLIAGLVGGYIINDLGLLP